MNLCLHVENYGALYHQQRVHPTKMCAKNLILSVQTKHFLRQVPLNPRETRKFWTAVLDFQ